MYQVLTRKPVQAPSAPRRAGQEDCDASRGFAPYGHSPASMRRSPSSHSTHDFEAGFQAYCASQARQIGEHPGYQVAPVKKTPDLRIMRTFALLALSGIDISCCLQI